MPTKYVKITPDEEITVVEVNDFRDIQKHVDGFFTSVPVIEDAVIPKNSTVFVNDEGLLLGLDQNILAERITGYRGPLVGNVLIAGPVDEYGETLSITRENVDAIFGFSNLKLVEA